MAIRLVGWATICCLLRWLRRIWRRSTGWGSTKAPKFLSICPHCVRTMSTDWQEAGRTVEIEHHSELLARYAAQLPIYEEVPEIVAGEGCLSRSLLSGAVSGRLR